MQKHVIGKISTLGDNEVICPHCQARNSSRAYCCLTCFKVMRQGFKIPLWKRLFPANRAVLLFSLLFCISTIIVIRSWLTRVEHHLENIHASTEQYHESTMLYIKKQVDDIPKMTNEEYRALQQLANELEAASAQ